MHGKKWKEELNLYIDLTMDDDNEPAKVKLFLYLIGTSGRVDNQGSLRRHI
jgi:hypothetical protein